MYVLVRMCFLHLINVRALNRFNHRLRNITSSIDDWDKELVLLSQLTGVLNASKSIDDGHDEEMEDDEEMKKALNFSAIIVNEVKFKKKTLSKFNIITDIRLKS